MYKNKHITLYTPTRQILVFKNYINILPTIYNHINNIEQANSISNYRYNNQSCTKQHHKRKTEQIPIPVLQIL